MSPNYSLFSLPLYWIIALWPHGHAASSLPTSTTPYYITNAKSQVKLIQSANNKYWNNKNPRGAETNATYAKTVPAATYARFERAEAAHKNAMENAPFFIGAVVAGNMAGVGAGMYLYHFIFEILERVEVTNHNG
jgi:uncharacterized MAPEG superfamily protein